MDLLEKLTDSFRRMDHDFFIIGATARDIVMQQMLNTSSRRKTRDLDLAIAVPNWQEFDKIKNSLIADGFEKDKAKHQRFYYGDYEIDVVPYGYVAKEDDNIYWPPEETIAMSVKGFDEVLSDAITVSIDDRFTKESRIPSPIQISIIASVLRPNVPNTPILSVDQPQN